MAKDCATLLSIALQHGVPVDEIKAALSQEKTGEMRGPIGVALEMLEVRDERRF
jgi:DNA-binding transcriptional MerR regulator